MDNNKKSLNLEKINAIFIGKPLSAEETEELFYNSVMNREELNEIFNPASYYEDTKKRGFLNLEEMNQRFFSKYPGTVDNEQPAEDYLQPQSSYDNGYIQDSNQDEYMKPQGFNGEFIPAKEYIDSKDSIEKSLFEYANSTKSNDAEEQKTPGQAMENSGSIIIGITDGEKPEQMYEDSRKELQHEHDRQAYDVTLGSIREELKNDNADIIEEPIKEETENNADYSAHIQNVDKKARIKKKKNRYSIKNIIIYSVICGLVFSVISVMFAFAVTMNTSHSIFGYCLFSITDESMRDQFAIGDVAIIKKGPAVNIKENDIIAFKLQNGPDTWIRRVNEIIKKEGEPVALDFRTKSDSPNQLDPFLVSDDQVIGVAVRRMAGYTKPIAYLQKNIWPAIFSLILILLILISIPVTMIILRRGKIPPSQLVPE